MWALFLGGEWLTLREVCQRTGISHYALRQRLNQTRHLHDVFDPEILANPDPQIYEQAHRAYLRNRELDWATIARLTGFKSGREAQVFGLRTIRRLREQNAHLREALRSDGREREEWMSIY